MQASLDGSHPVLQRILQLTEMLGRANVPVLIVGEDGSGRETLARVIHSRGYKAESDFVALDCRTIRADEKEAPRTLDRLLRECEDERAAGERGETLFLRDVVEMPANQQRILARALANGRTARCSVRVIASLLRDPQSEVQQGRLCPDLCDALLRVTLVLPPLRERRSDVPTLVQRILDERAARGEPPCRVTTEAMVHLWEHDWPGNVRELRRLIERLASASRDGLIHPGDLPEEMQRARSASERRPPLASFGNRLRFAS